MAMFIPVPDSRSILDVHVPLECKTEGLYKTDRSTLVTVKDTVVLLKSVRITVSNGASVDVPCNSKLMGFTRSKYHGTLIIGFIEVNRLNNTSWLVVDDVMDRVQTIEPIDPIEVSVVAEYAGLMVNGFVVKYPITDWSHHTK